MRTQFGCINQEQHSTFESSLVSKPSHVSRGSGVLGDISCFMGWVTLKFESSNHIAEGIIILAWRLSYF